METKNKKVNPKREQLKELSRIAKMAMKFGATEHVKVNDYIVNEIYTDKENYIFHTFHDWKKEGYKVKKGEKAFLVWGKPKKNQVQEKEKNEEKDEYKFFPLCYLFSNAQVEEIEG